MTIPGGASAAAARWAASGAMALSGSASGAPVGPPEGLVAGVDALGARITAASDAVGSRVALDWLALLGERAALEGLRRGGEASCGGSTLLLPCADGWIAVGLARPSDVDGLPAWLGIDPAAVADAWPPTPAVWGQVRVAVAERAGADLVEAASVLGIPVGVLGERMPDPAGGVATPLLGAGDGPRRVARDGRLRVLDLSALWAGPLCAHLLGLAGAEVVKLESVERPDGSRVGSPGLFRLLNAGSRSVALDLTTSGGRAGLARLVRRADVVVESSRPRALEQMGVVASEVLAADDGPHVWVSITGHGRASGRVALGDDAAVAGGLVVEADGRPWFCADAAADPLAGMAGAAAALEAVAAGDTVLVDVAMSGVAASMAGPTAVAPATEPAPPRARTADGDPPAFGADSSTILVGW